MNRAVVMLAIGAAALSACNAALSVDERDEWMGYRASNPHRGREWVSVAVSSVDRRGADEAQVDDTAAFTLEGGYDLLVTEVFRAGLEIGAVWSRHDVELQSGTNDDPRMSVTRWNLGARACVAIRPLAVIYADGGIYVRSEDSDDEPSFEQDGRGSYVGGGLDFWFDGTGRFGPFIRYYDFADSDLNEVLVGLSATFML